MALELDTITKQLLSDNKALSDLVDYLAGKNARLREALRILAEDIESNLYEDARTEADKAYNLGIKHSMELARAALKEKE